MARSDLPGDVAKEFPRQGGALDGDSVVETLKSEPYFVPGLFRGIICSSTHSGKFLRNIFGCKGKIEL